MTQETVIEVDAELSIPYEKDQTGIGSIEVSE